MSQEELANRLGVTKTKVSSWECGRNFPRAKTRRLLAEVLCVEPEYVTEAARIAVAGFKTKREAKAAEGDAA